MDAKPVNLIEALGSFDEVYSPRIVARMNDYDVRIAHTKGEHVWHVHQDTDEFFLVLDGRFDIALRDGDGRQTTVSLGEGRHVRRTQGHRAQAGLAGWGDSHVRAIGDLDDRGPLRRRDSRARGQHYRPRTDLNLHAGPVPGTRWPPDEFQGDAQGPSGCAQPYATTD